MFIELWQTKIKLLPFCSLDHAAKNSAGGVMNKCSMQTPGMARGVWHADAWYGTWSVACRRLVWHVECGIQTPGMARGVWHSDAWYGTWSVAVFKISHSIFTIAHSILKALGIQYIQDYTVNIQD